MDVVSGLVVEVDVDGMMGGFIIFCWIYSQLVRAYSSSTFRSNGLMDGLVGGKFNKGILMKTVVS